MQVYEGQEKYIFVSYAHKDNPRVIPIIEEMAEEGFRIWYDTGIEAGTEWPEYIGERLAKCECFITFISPSAVASDNCRNEIYLACKLNKKILVAYLENTDLSYGLDLQLGSKQSIFLARQIDRDDFVEQICIAPILQECKKNADPDDPPRSKRRKMDVGMKIAMISCLVLAALSRVLASFDVIGEAVALGAIAFLGVLAFFFMAMGYADKEGILEWRIGRYVFQMKLPKKGRRGYIIAAAILIMLGMFIIYILFL